MRRGVDVRCSRSATLRFVDGTYRDYLKHFRYKCERVGIHGVHGYRHRYAQRRYRELTGWVTGLEAALRTDVGRARDALRAMLGNVELIEENGAVYAECDNAAERLLLAVGGVSMGRVAGTGFEPVTFGL